MTMGKVRIPMGSALAHVLTAVDSSSSRTDPGDAVLHAAVSQDADEQLEFSILLEDVLSNTKQKSTR